MQGAKRAIVSGAIRDDVGARMKVLLHQGLTDGQRREAAALYWRAFGAKLGRVMGPEAKALAFIERVIDPDHVIAAVDARGHVLGVIGFRTREGAFVGGDRRDLRAVYGRIGALWRGLALQALAQDLERETLCVDGFAVAETVRGMGLGEALIEALCAEAQMRGYRAVRLDVVDENLRAKALYDRLGFAVTGRVDRWLTAVVFGYRTAVAMERPL